MTDVVRYKLIKGTHPDDLTAKVNAELQNGLKPSGDPIFNQKTGFIFQAMIDDGSGLGNNEVLVTEGTNFQLFREDGETLREPQVDGTSAHIVNGECQLAIPDSAAVVSDSQDLVVPVTGVYITTATVTVVDGSVTAIVLS